MELHDDDKPVGRVLSRREMLALLGGGLMGGLSVPILVQATRTPTPASTAVIPTCVVRPELTEGLYFVDEQLNRFDIRVEPSDESIKEGLPLHLIYRVSDVSGGTCKPLANAQVDIWHCDAVGVYSGVTDPGFDTTEQLWLRGYQVTDKYGLAEFLTIVPGWYPGRAVHIHFKIRTEEGYDFASQFFFDPELIETLYTALPYAEKGLPDTPNEEDFIYQQSEGLLTLELTPLEDSEREELELEEGYKAIFDIGLDLSGEAVGARPTATP
jgi:protocatechuate 3,4-dioxygenase beta subunit